jgi:predicted O-linked N-acetylglucosamine transferase (SPINDLY family)
LLEAVVRDGADSTDAGMDARAMKKNDTARTDAAFAQGLALHRQGRLDEAAALYRRALQADPVHFGSLQQLGLIALQTNRPPAAVELLGRAIRSNPRSAGTHMMMGVACAQNRQSAAAVASFDAAIALDPSASAAYYNRGIALRDLKRHEAAIASFERSIILKSDYAPAHNNLGLTLQELGRFTDALASFDRAVALAPHEADFWYNRGAALRDAKQLEAAVASYDRALALRSDHAFAHNMRGLTLQESKRHEEAIDSYDKAIAANPNGAEAHYNRGNALRELGRHEAAVANYDRAIALRPDYAEAYNNRGLALAALNRLEAAAASCGQAITLHPQSAEAHNNLGIVLATLKRFDAAIERYDAAVALEPDYADAYYNRGNALAEQQDHARAVESYDRAIALQPDGKSQRAARLHSKMMICDWQGLAAEIAQIEAGIESGEETPNPFFVLGFSRSDSVQKKAAQVWVAATCPANPALPPLPHRAPRARIRLGYFSADFHDHATMYLMAGLFEAHDRAAFETTAFSLGPPSRDAMRRRLELACEHVIDVSGSSDLEAAALAREREIDIAIDLKGYTRDGRPGIFALRAAPLQVSYLGYPGTSGAPYIDYLIADRKVAPERRWGRYSEKIICMPDSYQVNDAKRRIADREFTRAELGLPPAGFVFCCFNSSYKIMPETFDIWMRVLRRVDGSVLWLLEENARAVSNLRREAVRRGVGAERLIFAAPMAHAEHLARQRAADLFLDTHPYNAHTTASDALWAGLPVLTYVGETFAGRVASSLLSAVGLSELIAPDADAYGEMAVELAMNPSWLGRIKHRLADCRGGAALFDTALFARNLEAAFARIHTRYQAGLPPGHIDLEQHREIQR